MNTSSSASKPLRTTTSMRLSPDDLALLKRLADEDFRSVSALIRWMAHQEARRRANGDGT